MVPLSEIVAIIREPARLDETVARRGVAAVLDMLRREEVAAYVAWLRPDAAWLADDRRRAILESSVQDAEVRRVCTALAAAGVTPVIFKGGAWAHTVYPASWCRRRLDTDLLVAASERDRAFAVMDALGYRRSGRIPGAVVNAQEAFYREVVAGTSMTVDLHWQISNRARLAAALPADGVLASSRPAPFAGEGAKQTTVEDALLIACLHPIAHHVNSAPLKWAVDVARLASTFGEAQAARWVVRARAAGIATLVHRALSDARELVPDPDSMPMLSASTLDSLGPLSADSWLDDDRQELRDAMDDLRALRSWRSRARLIREHVFPPPWFLEARYGRRHPAWWPWLYAHRAIVGGVRWVMAWRPARRG